MIANHKGEIPFLILLLPFILGISLAINFPSDVNIKSLILFLFVSGSIFIGFNLGYTRLSIYKHRWIGGGLIVIILFLAGYLSLVNNNELNNKKHFSKASAQYLVAKINSEPVYKNGWLRFTVNVEQTINNNKHADATGTLLITLKDIAPELTYGDVLLIPAKYTIVNPPFNPAEFNYKRYLANQNIYYQQFLFAKQYSVLAKGKGNELISYSLHKRRVLVEKLKRSMHDTSAIAVASTLILGYKADLSDDVLQAYSKTGTIHVLSVSGAHVAVVYILLTFALGFLNRFKYGKLLKALIIITFIWYYAMLTGFSPAVCRAAVMISVVVIGKTYSRYINLLNIMAASAMGLLFYNPLYIVDVGFQLSYLAVFGLIVLQPIVYKWLTFKNKWADKLWAACSVSIAAQVITFPLSAFYFHQFPVYFLISNLFIVIPTEIIMYSGIFLLLLPQIPFVSNGLAWVLENSILVMDRFLTWIEHLPYASITKIWLATAEYLLLYVIIISLIYFLYDKNKWLIKLALACILLFCISKSIKQIITSRSKNIAWLNLNKHKAIVFKNGSAAVIITDLKDTSKIYRYSVQPYLDSCRISNIRLLPLNKNINIPWVAKQGGLVQFFNKRVLLLNSPVSDKYLSQKLSADYIYITGNQHTQLEAINSNFAYRLLVMDGSNSDAYIDKLKSEALNNNIKFKVLKRNISLITVSN
ncbi:ComEC/Rec2 family competence protein [Mucilaginibacter sp.]|uniref:ComEC/Rec2 family competence protein n=1 Tax=Mucilaginibacter sp. TaxID=1882438 RepID=UPI0025E4F888|nr:ComEC/Rec2 family competence protein [Mucilaginibacter sp.]